MDREARGGLGARALIASARVLIVVDGLGLSGKTKSLVDLACALDRIRYQAQVCSFDSENSELAGRLAEAGVPVHRVPCRDGLDVTAPWRLGAIVRRVRPDVVHCYNPRPMLYGGLAARGLGVHATVGTLSAFACHVPDRPYAFLPEPLRTASRRNRARNRMTSLLMRRLAVVSRSLGERYCRYNNISTDKLRVIPYGVPSADVIPRPGNGPAADARRELGFAPADILVGSVGRLVEQKDYPMQLRGFALAAAQDPRLRMVLVGDGPLRATLEALAAELGIAARVTFAGQRADVPRILPALDIFVMTSKFEPYGVALLEAKAAGRPIVATAVNEIPEILSFGRCGLLVPPGDPAALADALLSLSGDAGRRDELSRLVFAEAREQHAFPAMLAAYQDLYDEARGSH